MFHVRFPNPDKLIDFINLYSLSCNWILKLCLCYNNTFIRLSELLSSLTGMIPFLWCLRILRLICLLNRLFSRCFFMYPFTYVSFLTNSLKIFFLILNFFKNVYLVSLLNLFLTCELNASNSPINTRKRWKRCPLKFIEIEILISSPPNCLFRFINS